MRRIQLIAFLVIFLSLPVLAQTQENLSPTETLQAYIKAASDKDIKEMKRYLSQGTLKLMEDGAKAVNRNLDDMLKEESGQMPTKPADLRCDNEKIDGDKATVDMTAKGETATMPLVKEDGMWKIALDKYIEEMKAKLNEKP